MTDTVTRLMGLADEFMIQERDGTNGHEARQALQDELTRLFTPLSDEQITQIWDKYQSTLSGWDYGGTEVINEYSFDEAVREIEAAHGITELQEVNHETA